MVVTVTPFEKIAAESYPNSPTKSAKIYGQYSSRPSMHSEASTKASQTQGRKHAQSSVSEIEISDDEESGKPILNEAG